MFNFFFKIVKLGNLIHAACKVLHKIIYKIKFKNFGFYKTDTVWLEEDTFKCCESANNLTYKIQSISPELLHSKSKLSTLLLKVSDLLIQIKIDFKIMNYSQLPLIRPNLENIFLTYCRNSRTLENPTLEENLNFTGLIKKFNNKMSY
ncbi:hypothetical protein BpHYR1_018929 [Brachionus plicatilis]|uniref:Uncharacterized protein n=1 Tax=Brachionus plicatilis TaxID=10195 RepID=A0A3M7S7J1_BRAPC|nr:hypothetical protein BpHYR1_018929 [Brachionus plicatilis]